MNVMRGKENVNINGGLLAGLGLVSARCEYCAHLLIIWYRNILQSYTLVSIPLVCFFALERTLPCYIIATRTPCGGHCDCL